jgi:uncharacterized damage-inducible protein DinB
VNTRTGESVTSHLDDLYAHQEWADAEHWRAFEAHPAALADKAIRERLLHIHLVQHAFLWVTSPKRSEFLFKKLDDFPSVADLKNYGHQGLEEMNELLKKTDQHRLDELIEVVWFKPVLKISVRQALTQAAMHSHYHRGQNATRLRELGGVPPGTDFIEWLHQGQPAAQWS